MRPQVPVKHSRQILHHAFQFAFTRNEILVVLLPANRHRIDGQVAPRTPLMLAIVVNRLRIVPDDADRNRQIRVGFQLVRPEFVEFAEDFQCVFKLVVFGVERPQLAVPPR